MLELGGNDAAILCADADLDLALPIVVAQRFGSSGQRCTSCKRVFVHESRYDEVVSRLTALVEAVVMGDPSDEATDMGPLISEDAARHVEARLDAFVSAGAKVLVGGKRDGAWFEPTLVTDLDPLRPEALAETFGPILPVYRFEEPEQAIAWVNASSCGLQAGVFTDSLATLETMFRSLSVGTVVCNHGPNLRVETLPFGDAGPSAGSREGVPYAVQEMTATRTLIQ